MFNIATQATHLPNMLIEGFGFDPNTIRTFGWIWVTDRLDELVLKDQLENMVWAIAADRDKVTTIWKTGRDIHQTAPQHRLVIPPRMVQICVAVVEFE